MLKQALLLSHTVNYAVSNHGGEKDVYCPIKCYVYECVGDISG